MAGDDRMAPTAIISKERGAERDGREQEEMFHQSILRCVDRRTAQENIFWGMESAESDYVAKAASFSCGDAKWADDSRVC